MARCKYCGKDLDPSSEKCLALPGGSAHLDCWVTHVFRLRGVDKEVLGALAALLDYLLSARLLCREISSLSRDEVLSRDICAIAENIGDQISQLVDLVYGRLLRSGEGDEGGPQE